MFDPAGFYFIIVICAVVVYHAVRVIAIAIALRGVPSKRRAEVLRALAVCFRFWRSKE